MGDEQRSTRPDAVKVGSHVRIVGASGHGWRGYGGFVEEIAIDDGVPEEAWVRIPILEDNFHAWVLLRDLEVLP
jgi:hypothetical protein